MLFVVGIVLIVLGVVVCLIGFSCMNEKIYRQSMRRYARLFGIDTDKLAPHAALRDPIKPMVVQGKIAGVLFVLLGGYIVWTGVFVMMVR